MIISGLKLGFRLTCGEVFDTIDGNSSIAGFGDDCLASLGRSTLVDGFRGEEGCDTFRWLFEMLANGLASGDLDTDILALTDCPSICMGFLGVFVWTGFCSVGRTDESVLELCSTVVGGLLFGPLALPFVTWIS